MYRVNGDYSDTEDQKLTVAQNVTAHMPFKHTNGRVYIPMKTALAGEKVLCVKYAPMVLMDKDPGLSISGGEALYDADPPTGTVNKDSTAPRIQVGEAYDDIPSNVNQVTGIFGKPGI